MKILGIRTGWNANKYREMHNAYGGVDYYRIVKPLEAIGQKSIGTEIKNFASYEDLVRDYDIILVKPINNQAGFKLLYACRALGKKLVVDIDDNLFETRENQESYEKLKVGEESRAFAGAFISLADAIICSTQPLVDYYKDWFKKVHNIEIPIYLSPNYLDAKDFDFKPIRNEKDKIVIGYPGSNSHDSDLKYVMPALIDILRNNKNVEVELVGSLDENKSDIVFKGFDTSKELFSRIYLSPGTFAFDTYPQLLSTKDWDIGIAPLINDTFNQCKSHIKWMEYAMYKIPCVASKVYPYYEPIDGKDIIKQGKTGYLARSKREFIKYLQLLIDNENLRKRVGENAYNAIKDNWQWDKNEINNIYEQINKQPIKKLEDYAI